jgi:hypothetical protein
MPKLLSMVLVLSFCFGLQRAGHADEGAVFVYRPRLVAPPPELVEARQLKHEGIALTVVGMLAGMAAMVVGAVDVGNHLGAAFDEHCAGGGASRGVPGCGQSDGSSDATRIGGIFLGVLGAASLAGGISMWVVGAKRERAIHKTLSVSPSALTLRF